MHCQSTKYKILASDTKISCSLEETGTNTIIRYFSDNWENLTIVHILNDIKELH